ncbi:copper chaperone PCu(A)C [Agromyces sp. Marseille-Q5079]|uniref:copper chaperone PCu(A)C n=1 Tax=Agromyces sp. Marseille-Q5079 TaxID=3439059 RepID=UPI003D9CADDA
MNSTRRITTLSFAALILTLTGYSAATADVAPTASAVLAAESISITDAWIKSADSDMTAGFGVIENTGTADVTIESATAEFANMIELHETVETEGGEMKMQPKEGGFVIEPGDSLTLQPGGDHLMIMDLTEKLSAGSDLTILLEFSDGSTTEFDAVVKDYSGANESYVPDTGMDMDSGDAE